MRRALARLRGRSAQGLARLQAPARYEGSARRRVLRQPALPP